MSRNLNDATDAGGRAACIADIKYLTNMLEKNVFACERLARIASGVVEHENLQVADLDRMIQMLNSAVADLKEAAAVAAAATATVCTPPDPQ